MKKLLIWGSTHEIVLPVCNVTPALAQCTPNLCDTPQRSASEALRYTPCAASTIRMCVCVCHSACIFQWASVCQWTSPFVHTCVTVCGSTCVRARLTAYPWSSVIVYPPVLPLGVPFPSHKALRDFTWEKDRRWRCWGRIVAGMPRRSSSAAPDRERLASPRLDHRRTAVDDNWRRRERKELPLLLGRGTHVLVGEWVCGQ
jgi:hypothetical protein